MFFLVQGHEAILVTFEYLIDSYSVTQLHFLGCVTRKAFYPQVGLLVR